MARVWLGSPPLVIPYVSYLHREPNDPALYPSPAQPVPESVLQKIQTAAGMLSSDHSCSHHSFSSSNGKKRPYHICTCPAAAGDDTRALDASSAPTKPKRQRTSDSQPQAATDATGHSTYTVDILGSDSEIEGQFPGPCLIDRLSQRFRSCTSARFRIHRQLTACIH